MKKIFFFGLIICFSALEMVSMNAPRQFAEWQIRSEEQRRQAAAYQAQVQQAAENRMAEQSRLSAENMRRYQEEEKRRAELNFRNRK